MIDFKDWLKETAFQAPGDTRTTIERMGRFVVGMDTKDVEEAKDLLMVLRQTIDHAITGGV